MNKENKWWSRQFSENIKTAFILYKRFKEDCEPNIDDLDKSVKIHQEIIRAYNLNKISFEDFIEIGKACVEGKLSKTFKRTYDNK